MTSHDEQVVPSADPPADLILAAYRQARDRSKPDWWRMTTPVLKNRMLQLDPRRLEELVGGQSFRAWLEEQPSLSITPDGIHAVVELSDHVRRQLEGEAEHEAVRDAGTDWRALRVRPDLWRAVVDYKSGKRYVWDAESQRAVQATSEDARPLLPMLTPDGVRVLRTSLAGAVPDADLGDWIDGPGSTEELPRRHRGLWNEVVKKEVVRLLTTWFAAQGTTIPEIIEQAGTLERSKDDQITRDLLRDLATSMRPSELLQVTVPLSAVARHFSGK